MNMLARSTIALSLAFTLGLAAGCDKPKSPDSVANDVATAEQKASAEVANSEKDASKDIGKAAEKVDDKLTDLNNTAAKDAYNIAVAKAEGDYKVALAKCNALAGDAQKMCKDQADADHNAAVANSKAVEVAQKQ